MLEYDTLDTLQMIYLSISVSRAFILFIYTYVQFAVCLPFKQNASFSCRFPFPLGTKLWSSARRKICENMWQVSCSFSVLSLHLHC